MSKIFRTTGLVSLVIWAVFFFVGIAQKRTAICVISAVFFLLAFWRRCRTIQDQNSAQKLWEAFAAGDAEREAYPYQLWKFPKGEPVRKVLAGEICGESFLESYFEANNQPLPEAGQMNVVCDDAGQAICIVRTKHVVSCRLSAVTQELAAIEGYTSVQAWRDAKEPKFQRLCSAVSLPYSPNLQILFEQFEIVYRKV